MAIFSIDPSTLFLALTGSIIPAIIWLFFWIREDDEHPEPRVIIIIAFIAGILSVIPTFLLEDLANKFIKNQQDLYTAWAIIEELMKFSAAFLVALSTRFNNEPMDAIIYMIVVALGFAATENFLFMAGSGNFVTGFLTGSMRFVGATLLHTLASAMIGISMAISFGKKMITKIVCLALGISTAVLLHTSFNIFIIKDNGNDISSVFISLWMAIILLLVFFEKLKLEDIYS
ncbi:MAG: PrsW family intramembrane metalloprotease [Candidatus Vogelbacteria bacterium]|nr:PrsW family intramembrane metalloprotease [Candidatus Vogelbacteria bacterium]